MNNYINDETPAILALEDGIIFHGISVGASGITNGEVVFNTAMTGYQEVLTDPSYAQQIITFTCPHLGNTGINDQDKESDLIHANGLIFRKLSTTTSHWQATQHFKEYLIKNNKIAISEIDTRKLTRHLNKMGNLKGCIMAGIVDENYAISHAKSFCFPKQKDLINAISTQKNYTLPKKSSCHIVVYDFGVKKGILACLENENCKITVVPAHTSIEKLLLLQADGVVLSNGPGNPNDYPEGIQIAKSLIQLNIPLLGICLGHQLIALASGAKIIKMKQGHHGINHPVIDLKTQKVFISSQNHNFAIDPETLPQDFFITHISLFDQSVQGISHLYQPIFGLQGHPEAHPGPSELSIYFKKFIYLSSTSKNHFSGNHYAKTN